jgi:hypothetical protein
MVVGLNRFREHFAGYQDNYTLIGGTAVFVAMDTAGLQARATKDLDIVVCVETLNPEFASRIWEFVEAGRYEARERGTGKTELYRFHKPKDPTFPAMLELFSRAPDVIQIPAGCHLTPLPIADEVSSLSAILLDDDYYAIVQQGSDTEDGISVLQPAFIVPLKARAWLDLTARKKDGQEVKGTDIKKHRNDILRLSQLLSPATRVMVPGSVHDDLASFMAEGLREGCDPQDLGVPGTLDDIQALLESVYETESDAPASDN